MDEQEIEEALESLDEDDEDDEEDAEEIKPAEPTDEIRNAPLSSGLVQIGNDVFRRGGFYTVNQFIEEFGDRYKITIEDEHFDDVEINPDGIYSEKTLHFTMRSKNDPDITIYCDMRPLDEEQMTKIGDCIVVDFDFFLDPGDRNWYPSFPDNVNATEKDTYMESLGIPECVPDESDTLIMYRGLNKYDCYINDSIYVRGTEKNLFGEYPIYSYDVTIDYDSGLIGLRSRGLGAVFYNNTDEWTAFAGNDAGAETEEASDAETATEAE